MHMPSNAWTGREFCLFKSYVYYFYLNNYGGEKLLLFALFLKETERRLHCVKNLSCSLAGNKNNMTASQQRKNYQNIRQHR